MWSARAFALSVALFVSAAAHAAVSVTITQPTAGAVIGDSLSVAATISSPYALASVKATAGTASATLSTSLSSTGTIDLTSVATGSTTLTVTATDTLGNSGSAQVVFAHDRPPSLSVSAPLPGTVARPTTSLTATCTASANYLCQGIEVRVGSTTGTIIATAGASPTNQSFALDAYNGQQINLYVVATDSAGLTTATSAIPVYVDTSPQLVEVDTGPAPITDVDSTRVLYGMTIRTRGTSTDVVLPSSLGTDCRLSPKGALCNAGEWNNGSVVATWPIASTTGEAGFRTFASRGGYAAWAAPDPAGGNAAYYRDSNAGTTTKVMNTGAGSAYAEDVAANGDAIYILQPASTIDYYPVYRYRGGTLTALTSTSLKYINALTDGTNVIYQQWFIGYTGGTFLTTSGSTLTLDPNSGCNASPNTYAVNGGWTLFGEGDPACGSHTSQMWTRAPDGTLTQVSVWSTSSSADAVSNAGEVMMFNNSSLGNYRYLASPGVFPQAISSPLGHAVWLDNQWYVVMGRTLFAVVIGGGQDGGAPVMDLSMAPPRDLSMAPPRDLSMMPPPPPRDMSASAPMDMSVGEVADLAMPADQAMPMMNGNGNGNGNGGNGHGNNAITPSGGCAVAAGAPSPRGFVLFAIVALVANALRRRRARLAAARR
jgi:hypothetical protein